MTETIQQIPLENITPNPDNCRWVLPEINSRNRVSSRLSVETVMELRAHGLRNPEIAQRFGVKAHTIATMVWKQKRRTA